ncbi:endonuclease/exonuclease/phosphatase family protein [Kitasatospora sp. NPDC054939]
MDQHRPDGPTAAPAATRWVRGLGAGGSTLTVLAALVAALLLGHRAVPNAVGRFGSLLETFLPWLGLAVPLLLAAALLRRSLAGLCALLLPVAAWAGVFGGRLLPVPDGAGPGLLVVQHNLADDNPDPAAAARALAAVGADLVALEELTPDVLPAVAAVLAGRYPHHATAGTVGLWSRYPLADVRPLDIRPPGVPEDWQRALRATARTPYGEAAVLVAHLPSLRWGPRTGLGSARRDDSAARLAAAVDAEALPRLVLLGDLNGSTDDRGLRPLTGRLRPPAAGLAPSWPAGLPLVRIDQVLVRGAAPGRIRTLPPTGSDHLPVAVRIRF